MRSAASSRTGTLSGSPYTVADELNTSRFTPAACIACSRWMVPAMLLSK